MAKYKVIVDSSSDMPEEIAKRYDITVLGMPITFVDGSVYLDWVELKSGGFYQKLAEAKEIPTTSQVPPDSMLQAFQEGVQTHEGVIMVTLSSKGSGTYQSAVLAKNMVLEEKPDAKIEIIDSMAYSLYLTIMAIEAARLSNEGQIEIEEIAKRVKELRCYLDACVVVDTLKYLEKGGRINKTSLVMGTLLDIKPVLTIRNGIVDTLGKIRGTKKVFAKMTDFIKEGGIDLSRPYYVVHSANESKMFELIDYLKPALNVGDPELTSELGAVIGTHIGPGVLAVFYHTKEPMQVYEE